MSSSSCRFSPFYAEFYDLEHTEISKEDWQQLASLIQEGPILEAMCGSGRYLVPLKERAVPIEGLEICPFMIQACRRKLQEKGLDCLLHQQDIEHMQIAQTYQLIFILAKSLSMISKEKLLPVFKRLYQHLYPGGRLFFDLWAIPEGDVPLQSCEEKIFYKEGKVLKMEEEFIYEPTRQRYLLTNRYFSLQDEIQVQLYEREEIEEKLLQAGFQIEKREDQAQFVKIQNQFFLQRFFRVIAKRLEGK